MKSVYIFGITLLLYYSSNSQTAATNTGILYISSNTDIFYAGSDFTNTSTLLTNNGQLYIKGNLTNSQPPATVGTGTLFLNGAGAQTVSGSAVFKTFNLNSNNTHSAGITLNNNLSVSGTHTFVTGAIASSATPNYLIYEAGSGHAGSSDAAHVTGWVKKLGITDFTFPTGNGTYLRDIAVSNLSASMEINGRYSGPTQNTDDLESPLVSINPSEYWTLNNITAGGTTAQVTLNWNNPKIPFPNYAVPDIRSAQFDIGTGNWTNTGGSATGLTTADGSITSLPLTVLGSLSIGSVSTIVPLYFLSITAERKAEHNIVKWITANEVNVKEHQVQRSNSALGFSTIGKLAARNLHAAQTYNFNDSDNATGTVYYRVKSVDFDGKIKYSKVVSVSYGAGSEIITIRNNPVKGTINLSLTSIQKSSFYYQVISSNGGILQQGNLPYSGNGSMAIPLRFNATTGSYILMMNDGKTRFTQKIIIE